MSTFKCPVVRVKSVEEHPNADLLSIVKLENLDYTCISAKLEDGSPRYKVGDWVVYIPSAAVLPEWLLKDMDFWNHDENRGFLNGPSGNRVGPKRLRGIYSEGVLYPTVFENGYEHFVDANDNGHARVFEGDDDAASFLGVIKYEPPIPLSMAGQCANMTGHTIKYDFERLESVPDLFEDGEDVVATEKLHGSFCAIIFEPGLSHPEMFGQNGEIIVHSKGLGGGGLAFKNVTENSGNLYVQTVRKLLEGEFELNLAATSKIMGGDRVVICGEIFGTGVQDLTYGTAKPTFRVFDIMVGRAWLGWDAMTEVATGLGLETVPLAYRGPFDKPALEAVRDGRTMLSGTNIREGVVVKSLTEDNHKYHGRKIAKMISPDYLLRKSKNATEYT
jgi:RNA ligase (TIGR02306 family)